MCIELKFVSIPKNLMNDIDTESWVGLVWFGLVWFGLVIRSVARGIQTLRV